MRHLGFFGCGGSKSWKSAVCFILIAPFSLSQPLCKCGYCCPSGQCSQSPSGKMLACHSARNITDQLLEEAPFQYQPQEFSTGKRHKKKSLVLVHPGVGWAGRMLFRCRRVNSGRSVGAERGQKRAEYPLPVQRFWAVENLSHAVKDSGQSGRGMTGPGRTKRGRGNEAGDRGFATPESGGEALPTSGRP